MGAKKASERNHQGGFNPRPVEPAPHKQVGPLPTSGKDDQGAEAVKKKINEKANEKE